MKFQIVISEDFKVRLKEIIIYLVSNFSNFVANGYFNYINNQIKNLEIFPHYGKEIVLLDGSRYRCLISKQNVIIYEVNEEKKQVLLLTIVSANENYLNLL